MQSLFPLTALFIPLSSAWTLTWGNSTDGSTVVHETRPENCTQIWHQQGEPFSWDPEGKWCMHFYKDVGCTDVAGWSCDGRIWRKSASRNLSAFDVYPMPPDSVSVNFPSTSATSTTSSTTTTTTTTPATTPATTATTTTVPSSTTVQTPVQTPQSSSGISSGAIAGIVVGVIAAIALLAAAFFFLGRRNRNTKPERITSLTTTTMGTPLGPVPPSSPAAAAIPYPVSKQELAETEISPPYPGPSPYMGAKFVELPGHSVEAELSNSRQVQELDGSNDIKRPY